MLIFKLYNIQYVLISPQFLYSLCDAFASHLFSPVLLGGCNMHKDFVISSTYWLVKSESLVQWQGHSPIELFRAKNDLSSVWLWTLNTWEHIYLLQHMKQMTQNLFLLWLLSRHIICDIPWCHTSNLFYLAIRPSNNV